jgi:AcrR family transcriptional regulator
LQRGSALGCKVTVVIEQAFDDAAAAWSDACAQAMIVWLARLAHGRAGLRCGRVRGENHCGSQTRDTRHRTLPLVTKPAGHSPMLLPRDRAANNMSNPQVCYSHSRKRGNRAMAQHQDLGSPRKRPTQARARRTVDLILEAAAQILASRGEEELTTNHIAERAGFSIGTLYQYFQNRESILDALIERERENSERHIRAALAKIEPGGITETVREIVRILINSFARHRRVRKRFAISITQLAIARGDQGKLDQIAGVIVRAWRGAGVGADRELNDSEAYVLTLAVLGTLRAAVLENSPRLKTQGFEDALVRLILGFLKNPSMSA